MKQAWNTVGRINARKVTPRNCDKELKLPKQTKGETERDTDN